MHAVITACIVTSLWWACHHLTFQGSQTCGLAAQLAVSSRRMQIPHKLFPSTKSCRGTFWSFLAIWRLGTKCCRRVPSYNGVRVFGSLA
jgi:hypothetical protein